MTVPGRSMQKIVSMSLLISALVLFGIFHFYPFSVDDKSIGWSFWLNLVPILQDPILLEDGLLVMSVASFLMVTLLILASPFLSAIWNKSKLAWSVALTCSGLATASLWIIAALINDFARLQAGGWCLMFAPVLNFSGLLLAREKSPPRSPNLPARDVTD